MTRQFSNFYWQIFLLNYFAMQLFLVDFPKDKKMDFHFLTNDKNEMIKNAEF